MHLTKQEPVDITIKDPETHNVPLVSFEDIDRDGMMDMVFVYENNLYVYYNKMKAKKYVVSLTGSAVLCYTQE